MFAITDRRLATVFCMVICLGAGSTALSAQEGSEYRGTSAQQAACTPDVFRLCFSEIPDVGRIVACLKHDKPHLSEGCRLVFDAAEPPRKLASEHFRHRHHSGGREARSRSQHAYERRSERE